MQIHVTKDVFNLSEVFTISRGSRTQAEVITVAVEQNNVIGYGECVPYARYHETLESVADQITQVPKDATRTHLYKLLPAGAARNALDCALWDLVGLQQPRPEPTAYTLSLAEPEKMHAQAAKNCFRNLLKIKLGTPDDIPRLEAVRAGAPKSDIIVDANEGWNVKVYSEMVPHLIRLGVKLVEHRKIIVK